jgi:hypothetical protein
MEATAMTTFLLRSFDTFEAASAARDALVAAGFDPAAVQLRVLDDEAGPAEGNFLIGNGRTTHGRPPRGVLAGPEVPYEENFAQVVFRGNQLLAVEVADESQRRRALALLQPFGGVDPDPAGGS